MEIPVLAAPTASGKTALSLALAEELPLEIVSADAMMVYKEMDIGTAKPSPAERAAVKHHMIDIVAPDESFSVVDYCRKAEQEISNILGRGKIPFVVGGTGFYIKALTDGLPTIPKTDVQVQEELWRAYNSYGLEPLQKELKDFSPVDAERTQRNPRRVIRALEIIRRTGKSPAEFPNTKPAFKYHQIILLPKIEILRERIVKRTEQMFAQGLIDEVERLISKYPQLATAKQAIGYKEVIAYLEGKSSLEEAKEKIIIATRQYAKRQKTWFKRIKNASKFETIAPDTVEQVRDIIRKGYL